MKISNLIYLLTICLLFSCEKKDTICHEEKSIEALKVKLINTVSSQGKFISEQYGIENVEDKIQNLFNSEILLENVYLQGEVSKDDSKQECTCGIRMSFTNNGQFIDFVSPEVEKQLKNDDKYSSEYLRVEHLIKFSNTKALNFFFIVEKTNSDIKVDLIDSKVGSLLINYLKFSDSQ